MRLALQSLTTLLTVTLIAFSAAAPAFAEKLVSAVSSSRVAITSNFTGTQILVYGEIARDAETVSRTGNQDVVVVVEGPLERVTTWRKDRILGLWINATSQTYIAVPSFYAVHATDDLRNIASEDWLKQYRIGLENLPLAALGTRAPATERKAFKEAFLRDRVQHGLYSQMSKSINFLSPTLFSTTVDLPATIPTGDYKVTTFLFSGGVLLDSQEQVLTVAKIGFEQVTFNLSRQYPAVYGVLAIILALFTGWIAGVIFKKD
ncbi:TIGR02186 family protein [Pseudovibrio denitrificans]|uniref:TIGR02186 family protein n=1 Tax=Pseudovibrio denitrificans TaxID=258256 RepID=UPI0039BFC122